MCIRVHIDRIGDRFLFCALSVIDSPHCTRVVADKMTTKASPTNSDDSGFMSRASPNDGASQKRSAQVANAAKMFESMSVTGKERTRHNGLLAFQRRRTAHSIAMYNTMNTAGVVVPSAPRPADLPASTIGSVTKQRAMFESATTTAAAQIAARNKLRTSMSKSNCEETTKVRLIC